MTSKNSKLIVNSVRQLFLHSIIFIRLQGAYGKIATL